jgi:hypothetical protein
MKYLPYATEAVCALGYVKPEYDTAIAIMMEANEGYHPRDIALAYRKLDPQLSADEKRSLGLRANTFYSEEARNCLAEKGLSNPVDGLTKTILRAMFAVFRDRHVAMGQEIIAKGLEGWLDLSRCHPDCAGCDRLDGSRMYSNEIAQLPPCDCAREACSLLMVWKTDWLANIGLRPLAYLLAV